MQFHLAVMTMQTFCSVFAYSFLLLEWLKIFYWKKSAISVSCHKDRSSFRLDNQYMASYSVTAQSTWRARIQDTQIKTCRPQVCSSSVSWWGSRIPLLLPYRHCVPFQSPPATLVSFITGLDSSTATSRVPPLQEHGLFSNKGQLCWLEAFSPPFVSLPIEQKHEKL